MTVRENTEIFNSLKVTGASYEALWPFIMRQVTLSVEIVEKFSKDKKLSNFRTTLIKKIKEFIGYTGEKQGTPENVCLLLLYLRKLEPSITRN